VPHRQQRAAKVALIADMTLKIKQYNGDQRTYKDCLSGDAGVDSRQLPRSGLGSE
jgi:hypothetical protein